MFSLFWSILSDWVLAILAHFGEFKLTGFLLFLVNLVNMVQSMINLILAILVDFGSLLSQLVFAILVNRC